MMQDAKTKTMRAAESHTVSFEEFDLNVDVTNEGGVEVNITDCGTGERLVGMDFETFREVVDCVGRFGLGMKAPHLCDLDDVRG